MFDGKLLSNPRRVYTRISLSSYDLFVLRFSSRVFWKCKTERTRRLYGALVSGRHVELGVGSGFFLNAVPKHAPEAATLFVDLSMASLRHAYRVCRHLNPQLICADLSSGLPFSGQWDSIGCNFVLHTMAGGAREAEGLMAAVARCLASAGVFWGSTVVPDSSSFLGRVVNRIYNGLGIFDNLEDTDELVRSLLHKHFANVQIRREGMVVRFAASRTGDVRQIFDEP